MERLLWIISTVIVCSFGGCLSVEWPSNIKRCTTNDTSLDKCLMNAAKDTIPKLIKGHPGLGFAPLDPLKFYNMTASSDRPGIKLSFEVPEGTIEGITKMTIKKISYDRNKHTFVVDATFKRIKMTGNYKVRGILFLLTLKSHGHFEMITDAKSLFTTIPTTLFIETVRKKWNLPGEDAADIPLLNFVEILQFPCNSGYFIFEKVIYRQTNGFPVGGDPLGPASADIVLCDMLDDHTLSDYIFVDDIFSAVPEDKENLDAHHKVRLSPSRRKGYYNMGLDYKVRKLGHMSMKLKDGILPYAAEAALNDVVNENWRRISEAFLPTIEIATKQIFEQVLGPMFHKFPLSTIFPEHA